VYAIREVARISGRKVSLIGHGRGAWQFRPKSNLNAAYRAASQPASPSFHRHRDEPRRAGHPGAAGRWLNGASNIMIQDLCPARPIQHYLMVSDAVAYALALDALTHPAPADPARFVPSTCLQTIIPRRRSGEGRGDRTSRDRQLCANSRHARGGSRTGAACSTQESAHRRSSTAAAPVSHAAGRRLRIALPGDVHAVRDVDFKLARRLVRRDASDPFASTVRVSKRDRRALLRAIVHRDGAASGPAR
jgi:hypothetical protein